VISFRKPLTGKRLREYGASLIPDRRGQEVQYIHGELRSEHCRQQLLQSDKDLRFRVVAGPAGTEWRSRCIRNPLSFTPGPCVRSLSSDDEQSGRC